MGMLDRMRERMADLEEQERQKQKKEQAESRKRYRPEPDNCALPRCRWEAGGFAAVSWGLFVGLSFINNAGFWAKYVVFPYLALAVALLFMTRGWIGLLFVKPGVLTVKEYRQSVGRIRESLKALTWLWALVFLAEGVFFAANRPLLWPKELAFLLGAALAAAMSCLFERRWAKTALYTLWDPEDPIL